MRLGAVSAPVTPFTCCRYHATIVGCLNRYTEALRALHDGRGHWQHLPHCLPCSRKQPQAGCQAQGCLSLPAGYCTSRDPLIVLGTHPHPALGPVMLVAGSCPVLALGLFPLKHFKETGITPFHFADGETGAWQSNHKQASS